MTVAEPVDLTLHGAQSGDEEEGPFVIVNVGLLRGWIGPRGYFAYRTPLEGGLSQRQTPKT